jgi:hypothetical protein
VGSRDHSAAKSLGKLLSFMKFLFLQLRILTFVYSASVVDSMPLNQRCSSISSASRNARKHNEMMRFVSFLFLFCFVLLLEVLHMHALPTHALYL